MGTFLVVSALIAVFGVVHYFNSFLDIDRVVYNHAPGKCQKVEGPVYGSEDIEVVPSLGIAFVTSGLLYLDTHRKSIPGKILAYDLNQDAKFGGLKTTEVPIKGDDFKKSDCHPHGLSHWIIGGTVRLYVICHSDEFKHSIMHLDYDAQNGVLIHKKTLRDEALVRPNDVIAIGPDELVFTNDGAAQTVLSNVVELFSGYCYRSGSVYYTDGKKYTKLLEGKSSPNGIAYDAKTKKIFISMIFAERIKVYDISKDRSSLKLLSSTLVNSGCDNLFVDEHGAVYSGCHPVMHQAIDFVGENNRYPDLKALKHLGEPENHAIKAPSHVLRLQYNADYTKAAITEPYANDGTEISGSSAAVVFDGQLLVGSVFRNLIHCTINGAALSHQLNDSWQTEKLK